MTSRDLIDEEYERYVKERCGGVPVLFEADAYRAGFERAREMAAELAEGIERDNYTRDAIRSLGTPGGEAP